MKIVVVRTFTSTDIATNEWLLGIFHLYISGERGHSDLYLHGSTSSFNWKLFCKNIKQQNAMLYGKQRLKIYLLTPSA